MHFTAEGMIGSLYVLRLSEQVGKNEKATIMKQFSKKKGDI